MLLFATFLVLLEISGNIECTKPRSVNLELETVLAFDNVDNVADVKLIDNVQNFLKKIKKSVTSKPQRPRRRQTANSVKFTDFVKELVDVLKKYENDALEDVFGVINDEFRKYNHKRSKLDKVSENSLSKFVIDKLNLVKDKPAKIIRKYLDRTIAFIDDSKLDSRETGLLDYIDSLYTKDDSLKFLRILKKIRMYKSKSRRAEMDLRKLVRDSIRSVIFDHYSSLNINARRDLKAKIKTYFRGNNNNKEDLNHKKWTIGYNSQNKTLTKTKSSTTPLESKEYIDVFVKDLETSIEQSKEETISTNNNGENKKHSNVKGSKEITRSKKKPKHKSASDDYDQNLTIPAMNDLTSDSNEKNEGIISSKANSVQHKEINKNVNNKEYVVTPSVINKNSSKNRHQAAIKKHDFHIELDVISSAETEPTTKRKRHFRHRYVSPHSINSYSSDSVTPEKVKHGIHRSRNKKKNISLNKKISKIVTFHSDEITRKPSKKRGKVKATTRPNRFRIYTLWEEKSRERKAQSPKIPTYDNRLQKRQKLDTTHSKHKTKNKNAHMSGTYTDHSRQVDLLRTSNEIKKKDIKLGVKKYSDDYQVKSVSSNGHFDLKFILTAQKQSGHHSKLLRSGKGEKSTKEILSASESLNVEVSKEEEMYTTTSKRHRAVQESTGDEPPSYESKETVETTAEEEKKSNSKRHVERNKSSTANQEENVHKSTEETNTSLEKEINTQKIKNKSMKEKLLETVEKSAEKETSASNEEYIPIQKYKTEESTKEVYTTSNRNITAESFPEHDKTQRFIIVEISGEETRNKVPKIIPTHGTPDENMSIAQSHEKTEKVESPTKGVSYAMEKTLDVVDSIKEKIVKTSATPKMIAETIKDEAADNNDLKPYMKASQKRQNEMTPSHTPVPPEESISIENNKDATALDKTKNDNYYQNKSEAFWKRTDSLGKAKIWGETNDIEPSRKNNVKNVLKQAEPIMKSKTTRAKAASTVQANTNITKPQILEETKTTTNYPTSSSTPNLNISTDVEKLPTGEKRTKTNVEKNIKSNITRKADTSENKAIITKATESRRKNDQSNEIAAFNNTLEVNERSKQEVTITKNNDFKMDKETKKMTTNREESIENEVEFDLNDQMANNTVSTDNSSVDDMMVKLKKNLTTETIPQNDTVAETRKRYLKSERLF